MVLAWRPPNSPSCLGLLAGISAVKGAQIQAGAGLGRPESNWVMAPEPPSTRVPEGHPSPQKLASPRCFHRCGQTLTLGGMSCAPPPHANRGGTWGRPARSASRHTESGTGRSHFGDNQWPAWSCCPEMPTEAGRPACRSRGAGRAGAMGAPRRRPELPLEQSPWSQWQQRCCPLITPARGLPDPPPAPMAVGEHPSPRCQPRELRKGEGRSMWSSTGSSEKSHPHQPLTRSWVTSADRVSGEGHSPSPLLAICFLGDGAAPCSNPVLSRSPSSFPGFQVHPQAPGSPLPRGLRTPPAAGSYSVIRPRAISVPV